MNARRSALESTDEHLAALRSIHTQAQSNLGTHQRLIERYTAVLGRPKTVYIVLAVVFVWGLGNAMSSVLGYVPWDAPPFFWLQGLLGLYAAIISTTVLITQTRQRQHADHRAYLELQVSLIAEQKTAKLIELIEELRRDMPSVRDRVDSQANAMAHAVDPKAVMSALQETLTRSEAVPRVSDPSPE